VKTGVHAKTQSREESSKDGVAMRIVRRFDIVFIRFLPDED
jgi:hypothetical protein